MLLIFDKASSIPNIYVWVCKSCNLEQNTTNLSSSLVCEKCNMVHCNTSYVDIMFKFYKQKLIEAAINYDGENYDF